MHKHNTHGIVDDGSPLPQPRQNGDQIESDTSSMFSSVDSALRPGEVTNDLTNRYFTHCVCPLCNRRFRDIKYLKPHLLADHGKAGIEKFREIEQQLPKPSNSPPIKMPNGVSFPNLNPNDPIFMQKQALNSLFAVDESQGSKAKEYQCSFCSFSTPSYAFLYIHKRSLHAALMTPSEALVGLNIPGNDNNELTNQSESVVSIAKDQQTVALKSTSNEITSVGNTPASTPATTPIPIQLPSIESQNISSLIQKESQLNDVEMLLKGAPQEHKINNDEQQQQQQQQRQDQFEAQNILAEMANFTKRPTTYAIPQEFSNGMFMQSFLLEPIDNDDVNGADSAGTGNTKTRFVPSVVFLPVRERVVGRTTVSFSLTPA